MSTRTYQQLTPLELLVGAIDSFLWPQDGARREALIHHAVGHLADHFDRSSLQERLEAIFWRSALRICRPINHELLGLGQVPIRA